MLRVRTRRPQDATVKVVQSQLRALKARVKVLERYHRQLEKWRNLVDARFAR